MLILSLYTEFLTDTDHVFFQINFYTVNICVSFAHMHLIVFPIGWFCPSESENAEWSWWKVKPEAVLIQPLTWMNMEKQTLAWSKMFKKSVILLYMDGNRSIILKIYANIESYF